MSHDAHIHNLSQAQRASTTAGFFTVKQTADFLACSEKSVRRLIGRGLFKPSKALRKILIPRVQLESFYERTR